MFQIEATIKLPQVMRDSVCTKLRLLGVTEIRTENVPYKQFIAESRFNYDCVYREIWTEGNDVCYLHFAFPDSETGRDAAYQVEWNLPQTPLNLRYAEVPHE